jgi:hypothetical protein
MISSANAPWANLLPPEFAADGPSPTETAERSAANLGAGEISNSWAGSEEGETPELESAGPFNHPGIVITAAVGDDGYLSWDAERGAERGYVSFPASSPHVVAVGGTRLSLGAGSAWAGETVWNGDGAISGGCSVVFTAQPWPQSVLDWSGVGEDFDLGQFSSAYASEGPRKLNHVMAVERGVDQLYNYIAELSAFGLELA